MSAAKPSSGSPRLEAALACLALGWSVVPMLPRGKRPMIRWTPFQHQFGEIEPTVECLTGGGGRHLYFRHFGESVPNRVGFCEGLAWNRQRCRPPLPDDEVSATVDRIARRHVGEARG